MATTLQVEEITKHKLESMRAYPRETYDHVIERLIENSSEGDLSADTIRNIESALEDVKEGRTHSTEEVRRKLGLK